jgi:Protein of unknown function (DUF3572)
MTLKISGNYESAEALALKALTFLTADEDRLDQFLLASGIEPSDLKERVGDPYVLAGVLDHFLENESLLLDFAAAVGVAPREIVRARHKLPGANLDT